MHGSSPSETSELEFAFPSTDTSAHGVADETEPRWSDELVDGEWTKVGSSSQFFFFFFVFFFFPALCPHEEDKDDGNRLSFGHRSRTGLLMSGLFIFFCMLFTLSLAVRNDPNI
ncbi:hypothetical protein M404DRAFT_1009319 [Pisolithus tinctorius Marx 270]|uniref:Uncharacterized protein n=1 Tax=Pisolithus tinctorius Marx 270 TaxID=870435 RepID=A0A0C3I6Q9_PISTI|nr:hypothetical protein M404DRAFT_1009319 [Pisolithus tinctorius Marx 270]